MDDEADDDEVSESPFLQNEKYIKALLPLTKAQQRPAHAGNTQCDRHGKMPVSAQGAEGLLPQPGCS